MASVLVGCEPFPDLAVFQAVRKNQPSRLKSICKQSRSAVNARSPDVNSQQETPLHNAAELGRNECAAILIEYGADVNATDARGLTPLHLTASLAIAQQLIERKADINAESLAGATPLHLAAGNGSLDLVKLLLANGAALDKKDKEGRTAMKIAMENGEDEVVRYLRGQGVK